MQVSILTPTYNRAGLLQRVFDSLVLQDVTDFEWLIVDDGSTDNTEEVCKSFLESKALFPIRYYKKENGGKHTAVNFGVSKAIGNLLFILDSDDKLPEGALQAVIEAYEPIKNKNDFAGVAGLDKTELGKIIGSGLPKNVIDCNAIDIRFKYHITGDLKEVFRVSVLKEFPFPEIKGEKFCPEQLVWFRIAQRYKLHYFNKPIYIAEYQREGLTAGIIKARMNSPVASMLTYSEMLDYSIPFKEKVKAVINYWRFRACAKNQDVVSIPWYWYIFSLLGYMFHLTDRYKCAKNKL